MDVTSLLNAGTMAVEKKRLGGRGRERIEKKGMEQEPQGRSRTPWDAGGYSLPMTTRSPTTPPLQSHQKFHQDDGQIELPTLPWHKLSDSRSSLSSFASSVSSAAHSRYSSLSTVASHPLNSFSTEVFSPKSQPLELSSPSNSNPLERAASEPHTIIATPTNDNYNLDALATIAENRLSPLERPQKEKTYKNHSTTLLLPPSQRPSSPSDAILIKRAAVPNLRLDTTAHETIRLQQLHTNTRYLSALIDQHHPGITNLQSSHKRSASASDITAMSELNPKSVGPRGEPTPPTSYHPDNDSPTTLANCSESDTPRTSTEVENQPVVCMYIPNCDTGSQPRKAISHIFGRNKMCTRLIPQHVWVHYCRKHYQRSRYRNPKEYAKLQCDLVQQQIRKVHAWSEENSVTGSAGTVQDWGLSVRKREKKRLDDLVGKRKRSASRAFKKDNSDGEDQNQDAAGGHQVPETAVPGWLLEMCGEGYDTHSVLSIFNRLHTEILADALPCFPDIEILPNIIVDQEKSKSPKGYAKRTAVAKGAHKRSQSLSKAASKSGYNSPAGRRSSQPNMPCDDEENAVMPKRRRVNDMEDGSPGSSYAPRHRMQFPHRPAFTNIDERSMLDEGYNHSSTNGHYTISSSSNQAPLPAPTPQRFGAQSIASHLENGHARGTHRPSHARSRSDISSFVRGRSYPASPLYHPRGPSTNPSSTHPTGHTAYTSRRPVAYNQGHYGYPQAHNEGNERQQVAGPSQGHGHHRGTPMAQHQIYTNSRGATSNYNHQNGRYSSGLPPVNNMGDDQQQGGRQGGRGQHTYETNQAGNVFSSRR